MLEKMNSLGGPILVIPENILPLWGGIDGELRSSARPYAGEWSRVCLEKAENDYEVACGLESYAGILSVGNTGILVLGDPTRSAFWCSVKNGALIGRWEYGFLQASNHMEIIKSVPNDKYVSENIFWKNKEENLVIMDSADFGLISDFVTKPLLVKLAVGRYHVETAYCEEEEWGFYVYRLSLCFAEDRNEKRQGAGNDGDLVLV